MSPQRLFKVAEFLQPADGEPVRSVITESPDAAIVAWYVKPGQSISAHVHPEGQDTWTILSGHGEYRVMPRESPFPSHRGMWWSPIAAKSTVC